MSNQKIPTKYHCDHTWTIEPFEPPYGGHLLNGCYESFSKSFSHAEGKLEFRLKLRISIRSELSRTEMLVLIIDNIDELDKTSIGPIYGNVKCSSINSKGQKVNIGSGNFRFYSSNSATNIENFPCTLSDLRKTNCIFENRLSIHCHVSYICENESNIISFIDYCTAIKEDFGHFLNNEECSDVTVYAGGKKFPCHKIILTKESPVFRAMLTNDMKESNSNRIDIDDLDENVFQEVLRFLYTGKVEISEPTMTLELLYAADKYDLAILKTKCKTELCKMLTAENAVKILISISNGYNLENLKSYTTEFIATNLEEIAGTDTWNDLMSHPDFKKIVLKAVKK